jgi:hypothetical protein
MKATLDDFEIKFKQVPLLYDNESALKLTNNPVIHVKASRPRELVSAIDDNALLP